MTDRKIGSDNQGEGNRDAANAYNEDTRDFIKSGKVEQAAQDAKKSLNGDEAAELRKAEKEGMSRAKGKDAKISVWQTGIGLPHKS